MESKMQEEQNCWILPKSLENDEDALVPFEPVLSGRTVILENQIRNSKKENIPKLRNRIKKANGRLVGTTSIEPDFIISRHKRIGYLLTRINAKVTPKNENMIVIADITGNSRPKYKMFDILPKIYFHRTPKKNISIIGSPFSVFPKCEKAKDKTAQSMLFEYTNKIEILNSGEDLNQNDVANDGACEHCKEYFKNSDTHRHSKIHQHIISQKNYWKNVDDLIEQIKTNQ